MRQRPIKPVYANTRIKRLGDQTCRDIAELAERMGAVAKPASFPRLKRDGTPYKVTESAAVAAAVALVLDMVDDGRVEWVDLLKRLAKLEELDPLEHDRQKWERMDRKKAR